MKHLLAILLCCLIFNATAEAQYLSKQVTVNAHSKPVATVLDQMSKQGGFTFSYNSDLFSGDSLVSVQADNKTVKQVLDQLFGGAFEYKEKKHHIIIQPVSEWEITGYVLDGNTGQKLSDVSIYEPQQLVASLTNNQGYFRMKLHNNNEPQYITIRKMSYADTSILVRPGGHSELVIPISAKDYTLDTIIVRNRKGIDDTWFGRAFFSSKEKIQSMNLAGFFVDKPYQVSLIPGLGTHGKMSSQVENNVSFNIFGGYTAGVHGVELGGLFNLVKKNVEGVQVGGLFNTCGGKLNGVQASGLYNQALDSVKGAQVAGLANLTSGSVQGIQIAGLYNQAPRDVSKAQLSGLMNYTGANARGVQIAGAVNYTRRNLKGVQIAGVTNITGDSTDGGQISGVFNYTHKLKGIQIGLVNYADSSSGVSIGLLNIIPHGYHKLSVYTNEIIQLSAAFKSGTKRLYTIWLGGFNPGDDQQVASFGYGMGMELGLTKWLSLNPEVTTQHLYLGDWDHLNQLSRAQLHLNFKITKYLELFGGAAYNVYYTEQSVHHIGFVRIQPKEDFNATDYNNNTWGWLGWNIGISLF